MTVEKMNSLASYELGRECERTLEYQIQLGWPVPRVIAGLPDHRPVLLAGEPRMAWGGSIIPAAAAHLMLVYLVACHSRMQTPSLLANTSLFSQFADANNPYAAPARQQPTCTENDILLFCLEGMPVHVHHVA
jgi:hypothetical protein